MKRKVLSYSDEFVEMFTFSWYIRAGIDENLLATKYFFSRKFIYVKFKSESRKFYHLRNPFVVHGFNRLLWDLVSLSVGFL